MRPKPEHPVQVGFDCLILLYIVLFISYGAFVEVIGLLMPFLSPSA